MVDIFSDYNTLLGNSGIENANYRTEKLKHRLRHRFSDVIQFYRPDGFGMPDVVRCPNTPISEVSNFVHLRDDNSGVPLSQSSVEDFDSATCSSPLPSGPQHVLTSTCQRELFHTAMLIRESILDIRNNLPWPPRATDLLERGMELPVHLYNFCC